MKLILTQDVKNVGKKGQVVDVSDGYGKNFLLPRKVAIEATKSNMNEINLKQKAEEHKKEQELEAAKALGEKIKETKVTITVKAGDHGRLFGAVTNKEIAKALEDTLKIQMDKKKVVLDEPIRTLGSHMVAVKLHPKVTTQMTVQVLAE